MLADDAPAQAPLGLFRATDRSAPTRPDSEGKDTTGHEETRAFIDLVRQWGKLPGRRFTDSCDSPPVSLFEHPRHIVSPRRLRVLLTAIRSVAGGLPHRRIHGRDQFPSGQSPVKFESADSHELRSR